MDKQSIEDSARFSNFAQRVKMAYWARYKGIELANFPEKELDDLLLIAWEDFKTYRN